MADCPVFSTMKGGFGSVLRTINAETICSLDLPVLGRQQVRDERAIDQRDRGPMFVGARVKVNTVF